MLRIATASLKGGCGKTQTTIGLARSLRDKGYKIGIQDMDVTGPKIPAALGIPKTGIPPKYPLPEIDLLHDKKFPIKFDGMEVYSEALIYGDNPLMHRGEDETREVMGEDVKFRGSGIYSAVMYSIVNTVFSADLDFLIYDLPPNSSDPVLSFFKYCPDLYGCIIVCQPTGQSVDDIVRTIGMIKKIKVPLIGMVENMAFVPCPHCGEPFYPFCDTGVDLKAFCQEQGIPYLVSVPLTSNKATLKVAYDELADCVIKLKPVKIWERSFRENFQTTLIKTTIRNIFKGM